MPFRFSLDAVLHFRQSMEHQQELRLRAANQQVARVRHAIEQMDTRSQGLQASQSRELSTGITAAELRFGLQCQAELGRQKLELEIHLGRAQQLRDQQRAIFQQARRMRQTLEGVRDRQLSLYKQEAARREQQDLDDLFLLRREFLRRS